MSESGNWVELALSEDVLAERATRPRAKGVTMVIDTGLGRNATSDILEVSGDSIDMWKLSFGTSVFVPERVLRDKLDTINEQGVLTFPGGTLFEAAIVRHHCRVYMSKVRDLGFTAVEISDGTIELPVDRRKRVIECALNAGLTVISEVGKKDPDCQPTARQLAEQACLDLDWGSSWVVVEGRESGMGVGVFDAKGSIDMAGVDTIARCAGDAASRLVWEAPLKDQQTALIERFGMNVSLGNIDPTRVLALESLRTGLRFETLKPIAERLRTTGEWRPDVLETPE